MQYAHFGLQFHSHGLDPGLVCGYCIKVLIKRAFLKSEISLTQFSVYEAYVDGKLTDTPLRHSNSLLRPCQKPLHHRTVF